MTTVQSEKLFFKYILSNKSYFQHVFPSFFKNPEISMVYSTIHKYMMVSPEASVPTGTQMWQMVREEHKDNITKEIFRELLKTDLTQYDEALYTKPRFKAWVKAHTILKGSDTLIDIAREIEHSSDLTEDTIDGLGGRFLEAANKSVNIQLDADESIGSFFDDVNAHLQDNTNAKVRTGWETLDMILGGGLDIDTLNVIMGMTNAGKSLWMQNFAVKAARLGYDVVYFTLEMSEAKCIKRMGSMLLNIPINEYDAKSRDTDYMEKKLKEANHKFKVNSKKNKFIPSDEWDDGDTENGITELNNNRLGNINVKFFAAGTATIHDFTNHLENLRRKRNYKPKLILVDYITLMAPVKGLNIENNLYMKGKHLAEALRAMGSQYHAPVLTGIQVAKDAWQASDITLDKVPESKAIAETADTFWAIIRTEQMKRENKYTLKLLKQRDGDLSRPWVTFDLDPVCLNIINDTFLLQDTL